MFPIVKKELLAEKIYLMDVEAPRVAKSCLPGQFVIVKMDEEGERIPLTICDYDRAKGTVTIVFQTVGYSTERMQELNEGDSFRDFVGPLGCPSEICEEKNLEETKKKHIVFLAGGVGTAPVYPQVKWLKEHGVDCDVIMGARKTCCFLWKKCVLWQQIFMSRPMTVHTGSMEWEPTSCRHSQMKERFMTTVWQSGL